MLLEPVLVGSMASLRSMIIGLKIGSSEAETFWWEFLRTLVRLGLKVVKLVVSDAHVGLKHAIAKGLHATWQRCRVHWMRNALANVPIGLCPIPRRDVGEADKAA